MPLCVHKSHTHASIAVVTQFAHILKNSFAQNWSLISLVSISLNVPFADKDTNQDFERI